MIEQVVWTNYLAKQYEWIFHCIPLLTLLAGKCLKRNKEDAIQKSALLKAIIFEKTKCSYVKHVRLPKKEQITYKQNATLSCYNQICPGRLWKRGYFVQADYVCTSTARLNFDIRPIEILYNQLWMNYCLPLPTMEGG